MAKPGFYFLRAREKILLPLAKIQKLPRQSGPLAVYNFYFSGFRNATEDPVGNTSVFYFDDKGRQYKTVNPLGNTVTKEFDGQDHMTKITDPRGNVTSFTYDGNHNITKIKNALNYETTNKYDAQFRLTDVIDPLYHGTLFTYDSKHHLIQSNYGIEYDPLTLLPLDGGISQTQATYYSNGLKKTITDGRGTVTRMTYDDTYGTPKTAKTGSRPAINYIYDPIGRMTDLTDQVSSNTHFVYDKRDLLTSKTDPLLKPTNFYYDEAGQIDYRIDRKTHRVDYTLTPTGKPELITYPSGPPVHFIYNQLDRLETMWQDGIGNTGYTYWPTGRLQSVTNPYGFVVSYDYDEAGNLKELTYPGNKKVIYTYDELNRLKTVKIHWLNPSNPPTATYDYDEAGRLTTLTNFNGTFTTYDYDDANRLTFVGNWCPESQCYISISDIFALDGNGNRMQIQPDNAALAPGGPAQGTTSYGYNPKKNRLQTAGSNTFTYDDEGQLSSGYGATYSFDYEHRLAGIGTPTQFSYDGAGNRLQATRDGVVTRYIYDATGNLLAEADGSNNILRYYIYGLGLLAMVTPANELYCYHFNDIGSVTAMTDNSQYTSIWNAYAYEPFGKVLDEYECCSMTTPFKFVGQSGVMNESNGFYYMRARYYDPSVGRFISEDPIGFDGGDVNLMAYVGNNPVNWVDPLGLGGKPALQEPNSKRRRSSIHLYHPLQNSIRVQRYFGQLLISLLGA
jgi:RHS repeat-associated protein